MYPLPHINDIIDHLQGKTLFTKYVICWGYNNICIKEEDQWTVVFKTPFGLYQPLVTPSPTLRICSQWSYMWKN